MKSDKTSTRSMAFGVNVFMRDEKHNTNKRPFKRRNLIKTVFKVRQNCVCVLRCSTRLRKKPVENEMKSELEMKNGMASRGKEKKMEIAKTIDQIARKAYLLVDDLLSVPFLHQPFFPNGFFSVSTKTKENILLEKCNTSAFSCSR